LPVGVVGEALAADGQHHPQRRVRAEGERCGHAVTYLQSQLTVPEIASGEGVVPGASAGSEASPVKWMTPVRASGAASASSCVLKIVLKDSGSCSPVVESKRMETSVLVAGCGLFGSSPYQLMYTVTDLPSSVPRGCERTWTPCTPPPR